MVVGGVGVMGAGVEPLLQDKKTRLSNAAANIDFIVKVEKFQTVIIPISLTIHPIIWYH
jgi:hypothetical protein